MARSDCIAFHRPVRSALILAVVFCFQLSSASWEDRNGQARGQAYDDESAVEELQHANTVMSSNSHGASNALDSLFQDAPKDTIDPPHTQEDIFNGNQGAVSGANNQQPPVPPHRWSGTDALVGVFFAVAAIWLIAATVYSIILLVLIRLQARGELDIYDENLGLFSFCNGRCSINFGCILRRYAVQLERDYQRRLQQRYGNAESDQRQQPEIAPIRIMTREERRQAVQRLLGIQPEDAGHSKQLSNSKLPETLNERCNTVAGQVSPSRSVGSSSEGPICSICLDAYRPTDTVFKSTSCAHMFHRDCLMEWLERRNNTECPCCRDPLVSDDDVWKTVKRMRKEQRRHLCKGNRCIHHCIRLFWSTRRQRPSSHQPNSVTSTVSTSSEGEDPESQIHNRIETEDLYASIRSLSATSIEETSQAATSNDEHVHVSINSN